MTRTTLLKRITAFILMYAALISFSSCTQYANTVSFSGSITLTESGIAEKSIFESLKASNAVATIEGKTNGIKYCWTVFGSDINVPEQLDMGMDIDIDSDDENITVHLHTDKYFGFSPVLSIYVPQKWQSLTATVCDSQGNQLTGASLTTDESTIINFTLTKDVFEYTITGDGNISGDTASTPAQDSVTGSDDATSTQHAQDAYTSVPNGPQISDGKSTEKDKYETDPVPEGKQTPVEPEDADVDTSIEYTCTFSIDCSTILNNLSDLNEEKLEVLPKDGIILKKQKVTFYQGESVFDVLQRVCRENSIHMESSWTPIYNSAYIEGIHNIYEFDCGNLSGWMYSVNGWYPNYGSSRYALQDGDVVEWRYTCDLGHDIGCEWIGES